ncbi:metal-sulfur cluster assembly factor [Uliginosibacterium gangwonense]|uniref:metal-sulfur cluster assembly factor n=1 Tax=Uliginosibacterium gangwonense TaxID=392736 RepID=UPI00035C7FCD|nr:metal-sulfur cluster assembly factor [Uliginosibacterium gangwonense]
MTTDTHTLQEVLRQVIDPEVGMNIVDLGLVYRLEHKADGVELDLTMTSPACPMGESIAEDAEAVLKAALPIDCPVRVQLVWNPPWSPALMSEQARQHFGW